MSFLLETTGGTKANEKNHWYPPCELRKTETKCRHISRSTGPIRLKFSREADFWKILTPTERDPSPKTLPRGSKWIFKNFQWVWTWQIFGNFVLVWNNRGYQGDWKKSMIPPMRIKENRHKMLAYIRKYWSDSIEIFKRNRFFKNIDTNRRRSKS